MFLLLELLQVALCARDTLSRVPSAKEWTDLLDASQIQAITGICVDGIERLPENQRPPFDILIRWIGLCQMIEAQNELHLTVLAKTRDLLREGGVEVAFMKGLVCGSRYPNPRRRTCGDIDFVVAENDFSKTLELLEIIGTVDRELIHEHHGMAFVDNVQLEPHYKVHNFQSPTVDSAMRKMFIEVFPESLVEIEVDNEKIPTFPPAFECALLVGHMVNHVYAEGLGLRQVIDFMMFLQKEREFIKTVEYNRYLEMMKMERAFRIFACICEDHLGMSNGLLDIEYTAKEKLFAGKLISDIMKVGSFGRGVDYFGRNKAFIPLKSYFWVVRRCLKLGYLCPKEACWWPISKINRFLKKISYSL